MRSIHELLKLMLNYYPQCNNHGLCSVVIWLWIHGIITSSESDFLENYLQDNITGFSRLSFAWPQGEMLPRIEWLKEHIELTKEEVTK